MFVEFIIESILIISEQFEENETIENAFNKGLSKKNIDLDIDEVFFLYNGNRLDQSLTFINIINKDDRERGKLSIAVYKIEKEIKQYSNYICPTCLSDVNLSYNNYKINMICSNGHCFNNLLPNEFRKTQEIELSEIKCEFCNNKSVFRCKKCNYNLCEGCKEQHMNDLKKKQRKKHFIAKFAKDNYEFLYSESSKEEKPFQIISKIKDLLYAKKEIIIDEQKEMNKQINEIICKLNETRNYLNSYIQVIFEILEKSNEPKLNYSMINNIKSINFDEVIKDLNRINNNDDNMINKFENIMNLNPRMKYVDDLTLEYKVNKNDTKIKLFGEEFVKNNADKCKIIVNNKETKLKCEHIINRKNQNNSDKLMVILKNVNNLKNWKNAFCDTNLFSIPDLNKLNFENIENMEGLFKNCRYIEILPELDFNAKI